MQDHLSSLCFQHGYIIEKYIGKGKYGFVFKVRSKKYDQSFVIKRVPTESLCSEIEVMIKLDSFFILRIFEYWEDNEYTYMVMNYCEGGSLQDYVFKNGPPDKKQFFIWSKQLLEALQCCHRKGIAHRDIKPANILIDGYNRMQLADFGLGVRVREDELVTGTKGTFVTMAPEIALEQPYDPFLADIWSLGITLFFLMTKTYPIFFARGTSQEDAIKILANAEIIFPKDMDRDVKYLLSLMLQKDPNTRSSCSDILKAPYFHMKSPNIVRKKSNILSAHGRCHSKLIRVLSGSSFEERQDLPNSIKASSCNMILHLPQLSQIR